MGFRRKNSAREEGQLIRCRQMKVMLTHSRVILKYVKALSLLISNLDCISRLRCNCSPYHMSPNQSYLILVYFANPPFNSIWKMNSFFIGWKASFWRSRKEVSDKYGSILLSYFASPTKNASFLKFDYLRPTFGSIISLVVCQLMKK